MPLGWDPPRLLGGGDLPYSGKKRSRQDAEKETGGLLVLPLFSERRRNALDIDVGPPRPGISIGELARRLGRLVRGESIVILPFEVYT